MLGSQRRLINSSHPDRRAKSVHIRPWLSARLCRLLFTLCFVVAICFLFSASYTNQIFGDNSVAGTTSQNASFLYACRPKEHIFFMKTHKCASSSVQNIFLRYGDKHNLTFALPPIPSNYFGHPAAFRRNMLPLALHPVTYSIFAVHTRFDRTEARRLMPPDTVYITVLRDPVTLFESLFSYFELQKHYKKQLPDLLRDHPDATDPIYAVRRVGKFGLNQMSFDLGLNQVQSYDDAAVDAFIKKLDDTFDLVIISERMPESLVLLRYLLCWDVDDLILFKKNARSTAFKKSEQTLNQSDVDTLRRLNSVDQRIYDHFNRKLTDRLNLFDEETLQNELAAIEDRNKFWYNNCVSEEKNVDSKALKERKIYSHQVLYFEEKKDSDPECDRIIREELAYLSILRQKQSHLLNYNRTVVNPRPRPLVV